MILNLVVTGLLGLASWLASFLPAGSAWAPDVSGASTALGTVYAIDAYVPITEAFALLAVGLIIMNARVGFSVAMWIYRRVRG